MKAIAFAIFYTAALSTYFSTLSFAGHAEQVVPVQRVQPVLLDTGALLLDRQA